MFDVQDLLSESEKSLPASKGGHRKQTRDEANGKPGWNRTIVLKTPMLFITNNY